VKLGSSLSLAVIFIAQAVFCQANGKNSGLDSIGVYQETCMRSLIGPDSIANSRLFHNLKKIYVYNSADANELKIDSTNLKQKLRRMGLTCVDRKFALANDSPWIDFQTRPNHEAKTHNCILTISDVVKLERQPSKKYRLVWWSKHIDETSPQKGFQKLTDLLIEDLTKASHL
jgi:hypothetical protein